MMRYNYGFGVMGMGIVFLIILVFLALLAIGVIMAVRYLKRPGNTVFPPAYGKSLDILNERYARGEITEEEYKKMKDNLKS